MFRENAKQAVLSLGENRGRPSRDAPDLLCQQEGGILALVHEVDVLLFGEVIVAGALTAQCPISWAGLKSAAHRTALITSSSISVRRHIGCEIHAFMKHAQDLYFVWADGSEEDDVDGRCHSCGRAFPATMPDMKASQTLDNLALVSGQQPIGICRNPAQRRNKQGAIALPRLCTKAQRAC